MKHNRILTWLCLLAGLSLLAPLTQAQSRIAFINPDGQLATINPDGSEERTLSEGLNQYQFPAWSPDGSQLAALGSDLDGGFLQLFKDEPDTTPTELYRSRTEGPFYMYWAPNARDIAFLANHPTGTLALHTVSVDADEQILAFGSPFYWQWSSDSQTLFLHSGFNSQQARLGFSSRVRDTLGNNSLAQAGRFQAPGISNGGDYLAYATEDNRGSFVVLSNNGQQNNDEVKREFPHLGLAAMTWSPVKDELAFMSPTQNAPSYFGPISLLDAETGLLEPLSSESAFAFFWSPDGKYIVYFSAAKGGGDFASSVQHAVERVQLSGLSVNLIDVEARTDSYLTDFVPSPLFTNQFLPFFDQYALSHRIWSPDSDAIVVPAVIANQIVIVTISLAGEIKVLSQGDTPFWNYR